MAIVRVKTKPIDKKAIFKEALTKTWLEFTKITSIQGIKYSSDEDTNLFYRIIWLVIVFILFLCASSMVLTFYRDFITNPTQLNIETDHAPLPDLIFPAVTICSSSFISFIKTKEFVKTLKLPNNVTQESVISHIYQSTGFRMKTWYDENDLQELQTIMELNRYTVAEFMSSIRMSCDEMLLRCRWKMQMVDCNKLFQKSRTYFGTCCSFNIKQIGVNFLNERATDAGINSGLSVIATLLNFDYDVTTYYSNGFKLIIHKNNVFPTETSIEKLIAINSEFFIRVRPEEITCSTEVKQLPISDRGCSFPEEQPLLYFSEYDNYNCEIECQVASIVKTCSCVPYYFIPVPGKEVCNFTKIPCLVENYDENIIKKGANNFKCKCPLNCQNVAYEVQTTKMSLLQTGANIDPFFSGFKDLSNITVMNIFMAAQTYTRVKRVLLLNIIQLVSNCGSAFSLFLGISTISIMEIIYFFTFVLRRYYLEVKFTHEKLAGFMSNIDRKKFSKNVYPEVLQVEPINKRGVDTSSLEDISPPEKQDDIKINKPSNNHRRNSHQRRSSYKIQRHRTPDSAKS